MLLRLPIAFVEVNVGNTYENLLNEICQVMYPMFREKEITKKVYNNIMNSRKLQYKMNMMFMNSGNSKESHPNRLLINLTDKINLKNVLYMEKYKKAIQKH